MEISGFELSGDGEHDYLYIEKTDANTSWVARGLARHAGIHIRDVGFAGMKDRHAVTRQWFSVRRPGGPKADWNLLKLDGVSVLETQRHNRKLRRGALKGNRFQLRIRALSDPDSTLTDKLQSIVESGVPNYFGEQRFGRNGNNIAMAQRYFAGRKLPREQRSIALSAARSLIFNDVLSCRVLAGNWDTLVDGDIVNLDGSGSIFAADSVDAELRKRCCEFDIHPTGTLWGKGAPTAGGEAAEIERGIAEQRADLAAGLERNADEGRRALRLRVRDLEWELQDDSLMLAFSLTRGEYATAVLREIIAYDVQDPR